MGELANESLVSLSEQGDGNLEVLSDGYFGPARHERGKEQVCACGPMSIDGGPGNTGFGADSDVGYRTGSLGEQQSEPLGKDEIVGIADSGIYRVRPYRRQ